ncbi:subtype A tannase [Olsenella uli]|uniref:subtype A tannase n=1 Tax=Olsenella uli TaxID=133926 RepID=UPI0012AC411E|nr:subtype A tannase [Olsenella uli]
MAVTRREFLAALTATATTGALAACGGKQPAATDAATTDAASNADLKEFKDLELDMKAWHYDSDHQVWWQVGLTYCTKPATKTYERLAIYVPGAYLKPTDEKASLEDVDTSKTFECQVDESATVGAYTAATAPVVLPINAPDFAAQTAASGYLYDGLEPYLSAGLVYVFAGCRGRSNGYDSTGSRDGFFSGGAPWAVVDLKAAVRYLRYNAAKLPGSMDRIVTLGHAAGGLLAAVLASTGNASGYDAYLAKIGAATHDGEGTGIGDEVSAAALWCPESPAGCADAAYEWELGQFSSEGTRADGTWTRLASNDLAEAYAGYVNSLSLSVDGSQLALDQTDGGVFTDGSYYERLVDLAEASVSKFLSETEFPHTIDLAETNSGDFPGSGVKRVETPATPVVPEGVRPETAVAADKDTVAAALSGQATTESVTEKAAEDAATKAAKVAATAAGEVAATDAASDAAATGAAEAAASGASSSDASATASEDTSVTYATRSDYVSALNGDARWLTFNEKKGTARIADFGSFVRACRAPKLGICAFDTTERSAATNQLFGNDDSDTLHFSQQVSDVLSEHSGTYEQASGWNGSLPGDWAGDLAKTDSLGSSMEQRRNLYDPMYYLGAASEGRETSTVAAHWRINVGLADARTPLSPGVNLALALRAFPGVTDVAYTPVWAAGKSLAEEGGADATASFVSWVGALYPAGEAEASTSAATTEGSQQ